MIRMHPLFHPLYIDYCTYFNGNRDYFECHEVLEEYWKQIAPGKRNHPLVGYIQVATGMYHWRRGNRKGAIRILQKGFKILNEQRNSIFYEKIDIDNFLDNIEYRIEQLNKNEVFTPFDLIITDDELKKIVDERICNSAPVDEQFILHKHSLRDRSEIIALRNKKLLNRNQH